MKHTLIMLALLGLAGCSSFGNRLACTISGDKAFVVSEYGGRIGIATKLDDRDREQVCK